MFSLEVFKLDEKVCISPSLKMKNGVCSFRVCKFHSLLLKKLNKYGTDLLYYHVYIYTRILIKNNGKILLFSQTLENDRDAILSLKIRSCYPTERISISCGASGQRIKNFK